MQKNKQTGNSLIRLVIIYIPFNSLPKTIYQVPELSLFFFRSKETFKIPGSKRDYHKLGIAIYDLPEANSLPGIEQKAKNIVSFFNFLFRSPWSYQWLLSDPFKKGLKQYGVQTLDELKNDLDELEFKKNIEGASGMDFDKYRWHRYYHLPFVKVSQLLTAYYGLEEKNKLKEQIDLFALSLSVTEVLNPVYNNVNLQYSLLYSVLDSILKEVVDAKHLKPPKNKERIRLFVESLSVEESRKNIYFKMFYDVYERRNLFYHEAAFQTHQSMVDDLIKRSGKAMFTLSDHVNNGAGALGGYDILVDVIRSILIDKLLCLVPESKAQETAASV